MYGHRPRPAPRVERRHAASSVVRAATLTAHRDKPCPDIGATRNSHPDAKPDTFCPDESRPSALLHSCLHPMTQPIDHPNRDLASNARVPHGGRRALRIALRLWGIDERDAQAWLPGLRSQHPQLAWRIARDRAAAGADIVVHVVNPAARPSDGFCWNCIGANGALARPLDRARTEVALLAGDAHALPHRHAGLWTLAGTLDTRTALHALARSLQASAAHLSDGRLVVRHDLLALIAARLDAMDASPGAN
ncbi:MULTISPECIES: hypothetical protein [unclassified Burkholderia]|uniref:hypothetical protein n=1 Tax=unclassified Burkholderia TaxID=2613784 RepID=UPI000F582C2B|nr:MULTISPECIES: hypothetical protein [unclassified Burkholderia]